MKKIQFIYFDIGGVLIDWSEAFKTVTSKFNIPFSDFLSVWNKYDDKITRGKITSQEFWNLVREDLHIKGGRDFNFLKNWVKDYEPITEMHNLAISFKKKCKVGILTNIYKGMINLLINSNLIPNISYSAIIESCEVGFKKPEPEIYHIATKKAAAEPNRILLIDDRQDFIEGAKKHGWNTYLFDPVNIKKSVEDLKKIAQKFKAISV